MTIASATDVFFDQLKDLKSATEQVAQTLPDLREWSSNPGLHEIFAQHFSSTTSHVQEILGILRAHSVEPGDDLCKAIAGLIEGGNNHIEAAGDSMVRDILLIAHSYRLGHYLIAASDFTLGIAKVCGSSAEIDTIAAILAAQQKFCRRLATAGANVFGVELGGGT